MAAYKARHRDASTSCTSNVSSSLDDLKVAGTPDRISFYDGPGPDGQHLHRAPHHRPEDRLAGVRRAEDGDAARGLLPRASSTTPPAVSARHCREVNQDWGLIIHLPAGSAACTVHWINLTVGWQGVQLAQDVRSAAPQSAVW